MNRRQFVLRARLLRKRSTKEERILWKYLKDRTQFPCIFRRQHPIGPYIADFYSKQSRLVIEIDGAQHSQHHEYDQERTRYLNAQGLFVLRFWNHEVTHHLLEVLEVIQQHTSLSRSR